MIWRSWVQTPVGSNLGCIVLLSLVVLEPTTFRVSAMIFSPLLIVIAGAWLLLLNDQKVSKALYWTTLNRLDLPGFVAHSPWTLPSWWPCVSWCLQLKVSPNFLRARCIYSGALLTCRFLCHFLFVTMEENDQFVMCLSYLEVSGKPFMLWLLSTLQ